MATAGAKPTLTLAVSKSICDAVAKCVPILFAAGSIGVPERSVQRWIALGKQNKGEPYDSFWQDIQKARFKAVNVRLQRIRHAGRKTWPANAWLLERMHPEEFGTDKRLVSALLEQMTTLRAELESARANVGRDRKGRAKAKKRRRRSPPEGGGQS